MIHKDEKTLPHSSKTTIHLLSAYIILPVDLVIGSGPDSSIMTVTKKGPISSVGVSHDLNDRDSGTALLQG